MLKGYTSLSLCYKLINIVDVECGVDIGPLRWRVNISVPGTPALPHHLALIITPLSRVWRPLERGEGAWEILFLLVTTRADDDAVSCKRLLTNRSLLHITSLHASDNIFNKKQLHYIYNAMYWQFLKLLSQTHAKVANIFSVCLQTWIDLTDLKSRDAMQFWCRVHNLACPVMSQEQLGIARLILSTIVL